MDGRGDESRPTERYTVPEAAAMMGISAEAVRNRINRGTLRAEREGGRVFVLLESGQPSDSPRPTDDRPNDRPELVEVLQARIDDLKEQLGSERRANEENRRIIAALTQRIPAIEAPDTPERPGPTDAPTEARDEPQAGAQEPKPRSWWSRRVRSPWIKKSS
jgi:hypothetical protein